MGRKQSYYKQAMKVLEELHLKYPQWGIGRHFSMAFSEYGDTWGLTDKEFLFALEKYQSELELDENMIAQEDYVDQIVNDGLNLGKSKKWEEEEEDDWKE